MTKKILLVSLLLGAVGCAQEAPVQPVAEAADAQATAQQVSTPCPEPAYSPLPDGISVDNDFIVRSDRVYVTKTGVERRRTTLELLDGSPSTVADAVVANFVGQGFRPMDVPDKGDGVARQSVRKGGVGRINVTATSDTGANPAHPRSVGIVAIDWPLTAPQPRTAPADEATQAGDAEPTAG
jgi:hypothetical protein